jgi:hypothetical protein
MRDTHERGLGALNLRLPVGGVANGRPSHLSTPLSVKPRTHPMSSFISLGPLHEAEEASVSDMELESSRFMMGSSETSTAGPAAERRAEERRAATKIVTWRILLGDVQVCRERDDGLEDICQSDFEMSLGVVIWDLD